MNIWETFKVKDDSNSTKMARETSNVPEVRENCYSKRCLLPKLSKLFIYMFAKSDSESSKEVTEIPGGLNASRGVHSPPPLCSPMLWDRIEIRPNKKKNSKLS